MRTVLVAGLLAVILTAMTSASAQPTKNDKAEIEKLRAKERELERQLKDVRDEIKQRESGGTKPPGTFDDPDDLLRKAETPAMRRDRLAKRTVWEKVGGTWVSRTAELQIEAHWTGLPGRPGTPGTRYAYEKGKKTQLVFVSTWTDGDVTIGPGFVPLDGPGKAVPIIQADPRDPKGERTLYLKVIEDAPEGCGWMRVIIDTKELQKVTKTAPWNDGVHPDQPPGTYYGVPSLFGDPAKDKNASLAVNVPGRVQEGRYLLPPGYYDVRSPGYILEPGQSPLKQGAPVTPPVRPGPLPRPR
jgi:hypothetical protein